MFVAALTGVRIKRFEFSENVRAFLISYLPNSIANRRTKKTVCNKNRQKAILTGLPIFMGEGVAAHLGHQACR